jgi:hypothetical protein
VSPLHAQLLVYVLRHFSVAQATHASETPRSALGKTLRINGFRW